MRYFGLRLDTVPQWETYDWNRFLAPAELEMLTAATSREKASDIQREEALIGAPIANAQDPVEVGHVCRSYDSCLVCTVHAHDARSGRELARFRTA